MTENPIHNNHPNARGDSSGDSPTVFHKCFELGVWCYRHCAALETAACVEHAGWERLLPRPRCSARVSGSGRTTAAARSAGAAGVVPVVPAPERCADRWPLAAGTVCSHRGFSTACPRRQFLGLVSAASDAPPRSGLPSRGGLLKLKGHFYRVQKGTLSSKSNRRGLRAGFRCDVDVFSLLSSRAVVAA